ncbi:SET domain-containing protein [Wallemia mellicola CBS 633.66]|uniref:SET domain-containing protein n=1 Tax=Wallemia mellicola (strain ATCC MYA-4683 / CBS 633.66) TaxID=671144 RepID=I4Y5A6_WALMC|nr:SET domain-containing protein [Wallemia mellicola CBS 633.66]TIB68315.1 hypothetical protein E3Q24_03724 [Wallemia mellicola]EIM19148.1 SET domain-containing protein [Wallemia mellicola CBS 633.66]TIB80328.1 SET domain-containing protein [Wallemia mellicola]TIB84138.1 SET domain-containing protein [Wallemia mellicola]TIB86170.1 SET domain-containing protein [Wallemia mellicola]|eukprot:XP_006960810.1 SET domain-containing protein [Wallemia mellicola CBS 633.66]
MYFRSFLRGVNRKQFSYSNKRTFFFNAASTQLVGSSTTPHIVPSLIPYMVALLLAATNNNENCDNMDHIVADPPLELYDTKSAGIAVRASRDIKRGELLISELPLLIWEEGMSPEQLRHWTDQLTPSARQTLFNLSKRSDKLAIEAEEKDNTDESARIRSANGFDLELPGIPLSFHGKLPPQPTRASFLFPNISRINHSCLPSCGHALDWTRLRMEIFAMRDIHKGEDISIEYLPQMITLSTEERKAKLQTTFGFSCACQLCSSDNETIEQSDRRRKQLKLSSRNLFGAGLNRQQMVGELERMRVILQEEGYKVLPEFEQENISKAYAVFTQMRSNFIKQDEE